MVKNLKRPRFVMMLVKAGPAVDDLIEQLLPHLEPGDIVIDGGNTHFADTERRTAYVESKGLLYVGAGVSGGEEGALKGPSLMPGGSKAAWETIKPVLRVGWTTGCWPLCEDGSQRDRVWGYAAHMRSVLPIERSGRSFQ
jgi:6-phosphogluconate dehydrogenase